MSLLPMAFWGQEVPAGDVAISGRPDMPSAYRITMAAIDPSAEPEGEADAVPRATLKLIRQALTDDFDDYDDDDEDSEDFDVDDMERMLAEEDGEEDSEDDEEANGGPSDPAKSKKARREAAQKEIQKMLEEEGMDVDEEDLPNGINGSKKSAKALGKMPLGDDEEEDEDEDEDEDSDSEGGEIEEFVICTLNPNQMYQQPLDITIGENERVWFKVSGTHTIYLTGNYVEPADDRGRLGYDDEDDEDEYDLEPDMDEIDDEDELDDDVDELDGLDDPRITELEDEDDAPALIKAAAKGNKNKRAAPEPSDDDEGEALDDMIAAAANGEQKLSKKQQKKLKKNDGAAGAAPVTSKKEVEVAASNKGDKKVSFAKELEQGPTPTKAAAVANATDAAASAIRTVQGVKIDDKKVGTGQAAKIGDRVSMRYIGKLQKDNKVFDSNKKGKPFSFKLGSGEVIKGWDIGVAGMTVGGERRIIIPPHHAYGSKNLPGIPSNSTLVFDIKLLDINKGK